VTESIPLLLGFLDLRHFAMTCSVLDHFLVVPACSLVEDEELGGFSIASPPRNSQLCDEFVLARRLVTPGLIVLSLGMDE
jgi:hypothetical protein